MLLWSPIDQVLANLHDDKPKTFFIQRTQVHWCLQVRSTWLLHDKSQCVRNKWCALTSVQTIILQTINLLREKYSNLAWKLLNSLCIQIFSSIVMVFKATHEKHVSTKWPAKMLVNWKNGMKINVANTSCKYVNKLPYLLIELKPLVRVCSVLRIAGHYSILDTIAQIQNR